MKPSYILIFLLCVSLIIFSCNNLKNTRVKTVHTESSQPTGFLPMDTLKHIPAQLQNLIRGEILHIFQVDFNGDGKQDFICRYIPTTKLKNADFVENWITSDNKIFKTIKKNHTDYDFFWFVNLDNDPEPEIFSAVGGEDGIDYAFYDQNLKTAQMKLLFYVNPVIVENKKFYWGYPWDISDIFLRAKAKNIYLRASLDHDIHRDGNITIPNPTKKFPIIFFTGHTTQPDIPIAPIRNIKWQTLKDLNSKFY